MVKKGLAEWISLEKEGLNKRCITNDVQYTLLASVSKASQTQEECF